MAPGIRLLKILHKKRALIYGRVRLELYKYTFKASPKRTSWLSKCPPLFFLIILFGASAQECKLNWLVRPLGPIIVCKRLTRSSLHDALAPGAHHFIVQLARRVPQIGLGKARIT